MANSLPLSLVKDPYALDLDNGIQQWRSDLERHCSQVSSEKGRRGTEPKAQGLSIGR